MCIVTTYFLFLSHTPPGRSNVWHHRHYFEYLKFEKTETKPSEGLVCPLSWKIKTAGARKLCKLQDTEFPWAFWELLGHWPARAASNRALASKASISGASTSSLTAPLSWGPQPALPTSGSHSSGQGSPQLSSWRANPAKVWAAQHSINSHLDFCMEMQQVSARQRSRQWLILCSRGLAGIQLCREPAKTFHRILQSRGSTTGALSPTSFFLLPVLIDGLGSRTWLLISPSQFPSPHPDRSAGSESLLLTVGPEEMQMEKTIILFSSSSAKEGLLPAVLHPFDFLIFTFFPQS